MFECEKVHKESGIESPLSIAIRALARSKPIAEERILLSRQLRALLHVP